VEKYKLSNGMTVVAEQIPTVRSVSFGIWVKNGSRNETEQNNGISHFIEHMLFKGTEKRSARDIADLFDGIGGNVNAFTAKEYTCYFAKVLDYHLPLAVDALSDMFFNSQMDEEELAKERNVILEEISMYEDTPDDRVHDEAARAAYGVHSLAYPILGTQQTLEGMNGDSLRQFMKQRYTIENIVLSVAGNIEPTSLLELLETYFGHYKNYTVEPAALTVPKFVSDYSFFQKKTEQNHICISFPGCAMGAPLQNAMVLLNNALGGGMSSRLFQVIREERGLAYSVYSYHSAAADSGLFTIYAGTAPKQTKDVIDLTMEMLHEVGQKGLTEAELQRGKEQLKGSLILNLESTSSRMNRNGKHELMLGKHNSLDALLARIDSISMDDIKQVTKMLLSTPFAISMVGASDKVISNIRRDQLVSSII